MYLCLAYSCITLLHVDDICMQTFYYFISFKQNYFTGTEGFPRFSSFQCIKWRCDFTLFECYAVWKAFFLVPVFCIVYCCLLRWCRGLMVKLTTSEIFPSFTDNSRALLSGDQGCYSSSSEACQNHENPNSFTPFPSFITFSANSIPQIIIYPKSMQFMERLAFFLLS